MEDIAEYLDIKFKKIATVLTNLLSKTDSLETRIALLEAERGLTTDAPTDGSGASVLQDCDTSTLNIDANGVITTPPATPSDR